MTSFDTIINRFLSKITDDMYLEFTEEDTIRDAKQYLLDAIPQFEFPRVPLYNYNEEEGIYNVNLTEEEINILAILMKMNWLDRQIASVENTRMKYSGSDFKFTSQANHLAKLLSLKAEVNRENIHFQRLYKRRVTRPTGLVESNWSSINQSAIPDQTAAEEVTENSGYGALTQINVYNNQYYGDQYAWEPIGGENE